MDLNCNTPIGCMNNNTSTLFSEKFHQLRIWNSIYQSEPTMSALQNMHFSEISSTKNITLITLEKYNMAVVVTIDSPQKDNCWSCTKITTL